MTNRIYYRAYWTCYGIFLFAELIHLHDANFDFFLSKLRENKKTAELIKTANLLFNSFEPYYMWDYIAHWFEECCRSVY